MHAPNQRARKSVSVTDTRMRRRPMHRPRKLEEEVLCTNLLDPTLRFGPAAASATSASGGPADLPRIAWVHRHRTALPHVGWRLGLLKPFNMLGVSE